MSDSASTLLTYLTNEYRKTEKNTFRTSSLAHIPELDSAIQELGSEAIIRKSIAGLHFTKEYLETL